MFENSQTALAAILLALSFANLTSAGLLSSKTVKTVRDGEVVYDRYLLATSWAGSTCRFHDCSHYGSDEVFNLHGLWPTTAGQSPQDCSPVNFKEQNLSPYLKQNLFLYWNSFYHDNWEFMDHEITKHGSCWRPEYGNSQVMNQKLADIIQSYNSLDDYSKINTFLTLTLNISMIVDAYETLKNNGIVPSETQTYNVDDILAIFARIYNIDGTVEPVCLADKSSGLLYLAELRFCLDLNFNHMKCNYGEINRQLKRCRTSQLSYPLFPTHK